MNNRKNKILMIALGASMLVGCGNSSSSVASTSTTNTSTSEASITTTVNPTTEQTTISSTSTVAPLAETDLFLVGDSTVCQFTDTSYYYPRYGYGTQIGNHLSDKVTVRNLALSGRSSKSFLTEENYQTLKNEIGENDYLLIGFGHNDEKTEADRYTNPNLSSTDPTSFKYSLTKYYIDVALEKGATPILVTPIVRRDKNGEYTGANIHQTEGNATYPGGDYSKAIRELGEEKNLDVIDLTSLTRTLYLEKGVEETLKFHAWLDTTSSSVDNTHLNIYGAKYVAYLLASELVKATSSIKNYVNTESLTAPAESERVPNPNYVEEAYRAPTANSTIHRTTSPWWASAFGDIGGASKPGDANVFKIEETAAGARLFAKNTGKISGGAGDGIAMYFQKLEKETNFVLEATANITTIDNTNNQVGVGLMVRDDMYIDKHLSAKITGNYVACGQTKLKDEVTKAFTKTSGALATTAAETGTSVLKAGDSIKLKIEKQGNVYTTTYGDLAPVNFTMPLDTIDTDYIYAGVFIARAVDATFSGISLTIL